MMNMERNGKKNLTNFKSKLKFPVLKTQNVWICREAKKFYFKSRYVTLNCNNSSTVVFFLKNLGTLLK